MHTIGSVLLLGNGLISSYVTSRVGLRIVKEPGCCSTEDFRILGLFFVCAIVAGWAFVQ